MNVGQTFKLYTDFKGYQEGLHFTQIWLFKDESFKGKVEMKARDLFVNLNSEKVWTKFECKLKFSSQNNFYENVKRCKS